MNDRAIVYRRKYGIPAEWGPLSTYRQWYLETPVRNPAREWDSLGILPAARRFSTENFSRTAQGEDVVAGVRTPQPVAKLKRVLPKPFRELVLVQKKLEKHFKDMQDFEFTIENEKLYMLQTRNGKRTGLAAVRIAAEMVKERLIDWKTAIKRVPADQLDQVLSPVFDAKAQKPQSVCAKVCQPTWGCIR